MRIIPPRGAPQAAAQAFPVVVNARMYADLDRCADEVELVLLSPVYIAGPILGGAVAVVVAFVLRGPRGDMSGSAVAQGARYTEAQKRDGAE